MFFAFIFCTSSSPLHIDQPACYRVAFTRRLFKDQLAFNNVMQAFADLHKPDVFKPLNVRAVNGCPAALPVVAFAIPTVEGEYYFFLRLGKVGFKGSAGNRGSKIPKFKMLS